MYKTGDFLIVQEGVTAKTVTIGYFETLKDFAPNDLPRSLTGAKDTVKYLLDAGYIREIQLDVWTFVPKDECV